MWDTLYGTIIPINMSRVATNRAWTSFKSMPSARAVYTASIGPKRNTRHPDRPNFPLIIAWCIRGRRVHWDRETENLSANVCNLKWRTQSHCWPLCMLNDGRPLGHRLKQCSRREVCLTGQWAPWMDSWVICGLVFSSSASCFDAPRICRRGERYGRRCLRHPWRITDFVVKRRGKSQSLCVRAVCVAGLVRCPCVLTMIQTLPII